MERESRGAEATDSVCPSLFRKAAALLAGR